MKIERRNALFLDAGFASCGAVVINTRNMKILAVRVLTSEKRQSESLAQGNARRSKEIALQLDRLATDYRVSFVAGELPHGGAKSARAMSAMSMATAIIAVFCAIRGLRFYSVTPNEVKRLVRPKGAVSKEDVQEFVEKEIGYPFLPKKKEYREHIADAVASALVLKRLKKVKIREFTCKL